MTAFDPAGLGAAIVEGLADNGGTVTLRQRRVSIVAAGAARDGRAQVSINVDGANLAAAYLEGYGSPAVGDLVFVLAVNSSPIILGRVFGSPTH